MKMKASVLLFLVIFSIGCGKKIERSFDQENHFFISTYSPKLRVKLSDGFQLINSSEKMHTAKNAFVYDSPSTSYKTYLYYFANQEGNIFYISINKAIGWDFFPSGFLKESLKNDKITVDGVEIKISIHVDKSEDGYYLAKGYLVNTDTDSIIIEMRYLENISAEMFEKLNQGLASIENQEIVQAFSSRADAAVKILEIGD